MHVRISKDAHYGMRDEYHDFHDLMSKPIWNHRKLIQNGERDAMKALSEFGKDGF
jgi:hypothetical protein